MSRFKKMIKNKKGFGLVECVVALLLFSIVTGCVLTTISTSRKQVGKQNDKYKLDLMASNILAAYEGSNTSGSFKNRMEGIGISFDTSGASETFNQTIGTEGTEQYGFDTQNVPIAIPFSKLIVRKDSATFVDGNKDLVSFDGTYTDKKLQDNDDYGFKVSDYYNTPKFTHAGDLVLTGTGDDISSFTWKYSGSNQVSFTVDSGNNSKERTAAACDMDRYLYNKGYYLKNIKRNYDIGLFTTTDSFWFEVINVEDNQPIKDDSGKKLYVLIKSTTGNLETLDYKATVLDFFGQIATDLYIDFDTRAKIYYTYSNNTPSENDFKTELKKDDGTKFGGKWYFYQWMVAKCRGINGRGSYNISCADIGTYESFFEYTAKENIQSNIYYALNKSNNTEMMLFNSDGDLIFPYKSNSKPPLQNLKSNCEFGVNGKRNTQAVYSEQVYDKWYKKGAVPLWKVTKVKFTDGGTSDKSKIVFYGKANDSAPENEYITFNYAKDNYESFKEDRRTIIGYDGSFANWYNYTLVYNYKNLIDTSDENELTPYKQHNKIKEKNLGTSSEDRTFLYYMYTDRSYKSGKYNHTCNYYSYKITKTTTVTLANYKENSHSLSIARNGETVNCTEAIDDTATIKTSYTYSITPLAQNATKTIQTSSRSTPSTPPAEISCDSNNEVDSFTATKYEGFKRVTYDTYSDKDWLLDQYKSKNPADSQETVNGIVGNKTLSSIPSDLTSNWDIATEPAETALHTPSALSAFVRNNNSYDVQIAENTVFTAHPTDFLITAGGISANDTDCTYDIIGGESADIKAETYYITKDYNDMSIVAVATFSNYTKEFEVGGVVQNKEPKIMIWSLPKNKKPSNIKDITKSEYNKYLYRQYRKG